MATDDTTEELQRIADYHAARKLMRQAGNGALIFGAVNIAIGMASIDQGVIGLLIIFIGVCLLAEGIMNWIMPSALGILIDGAMLGFVGLWNLFFSALDLINGNPISVHWAIFGVSQIGWAVRRFSSYSRYHQVFLHKPTKEDLARIGVLASTILKAKPEEDESIIGFQTRTFLKHQVWKGQLGEWAAMFVERTSQEMLVAHKDEIEIVSKGKVLIGKSLKVTIRVRDQHLVGTISPESLARFEAWQAPEVEPA